MNITRTINGQEVQIELTSDEMRKAFVEKKYGYIEEDIRSRYNAPENMGCIARMVDTALDRCDNYWENYWMVIENVCDDMEFEELEDE